MMNKLIEKYEEIEVIKEEIKAKYGASAVHFDSDEKEIRLQYWHDNFFDTFSNYEVIHRDDDLYPYKLFKVIDGIEHLTILSAKEFRKHVIKEVV